MFCRYNEMRQSLRIVRQCLEGMPEGDFSAKLPRVLRVPEGECYIPVESTRGEMGVHLYSDGSDKPYRMHYRPPTLYSLMTADLTLPGLFLADAIVTLGSFDFCFGEVDR
jgi:NADH-quinone oxidoreductase subunit D